MMTFQRMMLIATLLFLDPACGAAMNVPAQRPTRVIELRVEESARDRFFERVREFATARGFEVNFTVFPSEELGTSYVFDLRSDGIDISGGNKLREYIVDPEASTGAPPPRFDPSNFEFFFYRVRGNTAPSDDVITDLATDFSLSMREVAGVSAVDGDKR